MTGGDARLALAYELAVIVFPQNGGEAAAAVCVLQPLPTARGFSRLPQSV